MKKTTLPAAIAILAFTITACAQSANTAIQTKQSTKLQPPELLGTRWQLVTIESMDDSQYTPENSDRYQISFEASGQLSVIADCNRGSGQWEQKGSQLIISNIATTRAECGPNSLYTRFINNLSYIRSFAFFNGHIFLATMADGAILEFSALAAN